jgi:hypothetical protein
MASLYQDDRTEAANNPIIRFHNPLTGGTQEATVIVGDSDRSYNPNPVE